MGETHESRSAAASDGSARRDMAALLREHPFAADLDEDTVTLLAGCARNVAFSPGDYVLREGAPAEHLYLLRFGTVALEASGPGGKRLALQTIGAGELLGASWLVPPYRWVFDARALGSVRALELDARCLRDKCERDPALGYAMMKRVVVPLVQRLQRARMRRAQRDDAWHHED